MTFNLRERGALLHFLKLAAGNSKAKINILVLVRFHSIAARSNSQIITTRFQCPTVESHNIITDPTQLSHILFLCLHTTIGATHVIKIPNPVYNKQEFAKLPLCLHQASHNLTYIAAVALVQTRGITPSRVRICTSGPPPPCPSHHITSIPHRKACTNVWPPLETIG